MYKIHKGERKECEREDAFDHVSVRNGRKSAIPANNSNDKVRALLLLVGVTYAFRRSLSQSIPPSWSHEKRYVPTTYMAWEIEQLISLTLQI